MNQETKSPSIRMIDWLKSSERFEEFRKSAMRTISFFIRRKIEVQTKHQTDIETLCEAYSANNLVLVLGAGISLGEGVPSLRPLLQELLLKTRLFTLWTTSGHPILAAYMVDEVFPRSPLIAARILREELRNSSQKNGNSELFFEETVRQTLYEDFSLEKENPLPTAIRDLCIDSQEKRKLSSIITYNYDDLIERYLEKKKIPYTSIFGIKIKNPPDQIPIFHVHGFLPHKGVLSSQNKITLSEDVYHQQYTDIYSWNNMVQINAFREKTCLFIGASFTDPNLRRLLDIGRQQKGETDHYHYLIKKTYNVKKIEEQLRRYLQDIEDIEFKQEIRVENVALDLKLLMQRFDEHDAESLGVKIIWIKDYGEIPSVLRNIKENNIEGFVNNRMKLFSEPEVFY